jgi:hypothetical protein
MDDQLFLDVCTQQYKALFEMIRGLLKTCPDPLWDRAEGEAPFWQQAYHTLFYCDLYLSESPRAFAPHSMGRGQAQDLGKRVDFILSRDELVGYLETVTAKLAARLEQFEPGGLEGRNPFDWTGPTAAHNLVYNLRHAQHHCGWMASILRRNGTQPPPWICTG